MFPTKQIRLWPQSSRQSLSFSIVVCFKKKRSRGIFLERLGRYSPRLSGGFLSLKSERLGR